MLTKICFISIIFHFKDVFGVRISSDFGHKQEACGDYGFRCLGANKLRLCADDEAYGPTFLCPPNTFCNDESDDVCQSVAKYYEPPKSSSKGKRCLARNERIADTTVPNCKGYILCISNKNQFEGIRFKCTGSTVFNGITRTCSSPKQYKCPVAGVTTPISLADDALLERSHYRGSLNPASTQGGIIERPIDCKNYKFSVQNGESTAGRATYFCPSRPLTGENYVRCTVFSNNFCITLHKEEEDQFSPGRIWRRPRISN